MKSKPITADSNHASELSDAALLDIFGGSTGYSPAADAGSSASVHVVVDVSCDSSSDSVQAGPSTTAQAPVHTSSPTPAASQSTPITPPASSAQPAQTPHQSSPTQAPQGSQPPHAPPSTTQIQPPSQTAQPSSGQIQPPSTAKVLPPHQDQQTPHEPPGHHAQDVREAFENADARFHDGLEHVDDGIDHIAHGHFAQGASELAAGAIELNPVISGLQLLHDIRHPGKH